MKKTATSKPDRGPVPLALVILSGKEIGREISLQSNREFLLGRLSIADIVVEDDKSSRRHARDVLVEGQITHAAINDRTAQQPVKTVYRLLRWARGSFKLEPPDGQEPAVKITENTDTLLLEGLQKGDELSGLDGELPMPNAKLALAQPLPGRLRDLSPEELDLCQLVHEHKTLPEILDHHGGSDLEACTHLIALLRSKFIAAT